MLPKSLQLDSLPTHIDYVDSVVAFHQYKDALELTAAEAKTHPDTLEAFSEIVTTVQATPELVTAYTGVLRFRGQKRTNAIERVRKTELDILGSLNDLGVVSDYVYQKATDSLTDITEIRRRAKQFITLFRSVIPPEQRPTIRRKKAKVAPQSHANDTQPSHTQPFTPQLVIINTDTTPAQTEVTDNVSASSSYIRPTLVTQRYDYYHYDEVDSTLEVAHRISADITQFLLEGTPFVDTDTPTKQIKNVLRVLAGHSTLGQPAVMERYTALQQEVAKRSFDPLEGMKTITTDYLVDNLLQDKPDWHKWAACKDSDLDFFPERGKSTKAQKAHCTTCPVIDLCLEASFVYGNAGKFGIWGGLSERQRRRVRRAKESGKEPAEIQQLIETLRSSSTPRPNPSAKTNQPSV